jgi:hypothetical protein
MRPVLAVMLIASCEKTPSKLEGSVKGGGGGGEDLTEIEGLVKGIDERLTSLENAHGKNAHSIGGPADAPIAERLQRIEANLVKREEALAFLEMAYAAQKRQEDQKASQEHDPNAEAPGRSEGLAGARSERRVRGRYLRGGQSWTGRRPQHRDHNDRGGLGLCLTPLPEGRSDPQGTGQGVRR